MNKPEMCQFLYKYKANSERGVSFNMNMIMYTQIST
jgi:hypothetical protein